MHTIIGLIFAAALPFLILRLFYEKALDLAILVIGIALLWIFAFSAGLAATFVFEPPSSTHFTDYAKIMPAMRAHEYYMWLGSNQTSIAHRFLLSYPFIFDLFYISTHYLFTFSKWPLWVFLLLAGYIIKTLLFGSLWYFLPVRECKIRQPEKYPTNAFGRREIPPEDEAQEVYENLERIRDGKPMR